MNKKTFIGEILVRVSHFRSLRPSLAYKLPDVTAFKNINNFLI